MSGWWRWEMSHRYDEWARSDRLLQEALRLEEARQEQEEQGQRRGWWESVLGLIIGTALVGMWVVWLVMVGLVVLAAWLGGGDVIRGMLVFGGLWWLVKWLLSRRAGGR